MLIWQVIKLCPIKVLGQSEKTLHYKTPKPLYCKGLNLVQGLVQGLYLLCTNFC